MINTTRRDFIKKSSLAAAGLTVGMGFPTIDVKGSIIGANERIRMGFIGVGNRGSQLLEAFLKVPGVKVTALCDLYKPYLYRNYSQVDPRYFLPKGRPVPQMKEQLGSDVARYEDYRRLLDDKNVDAVCIATPDHWHALQAIDSVNAGKDVYLEKPVSMTIHEGRKIVDAVKRTNRIVSVGYIRRCSALYNKIPEIIRSGKLGEISMISSHYYSNMTPDGIGRMKPEIPPEDFNWDMWLGPRAYREYQYNIAPYMFRWWKDYSSQIANNGSHYIDVVQWLIGENAPSAITAVGSNHIIKDDRDIPENMEITYEFASGKLFNFRVCETTTVPGLKYGNIEIIGTKGSLYISDTGYRLYPARSGQFQSWDKPYEAEEYDSPKEDLAFKHVSNFIDCVKSRQTPVSSIEQSFRSSSFALLANIALEVKQRIIWDSINERVTNCDEANKLLHYEYRKPWSL
ncbi:Gfo/Idh/MocA family oxidoreductase [Parabacteroides provencensis]|uniref:Gfo/Idh/MocA family oxidoreductase n=1 Tax=Parabacteroides provencensis TaxID=1944636 RepID=UPI000C151A61|nr:Gfo/Idh/MocA family oxidoreductase [Parabacteroides provencensis]